MYWAYVCVCVSMVYIEGVCWVYIGWVWEVAWQGKWTGKTIRVFNTHCHGQRAKHWSSIVWSKTVKWGRQLLSLSQIDTFPPLNLTLTDMIYDLGSRGNIKIMYGTASLAWDDQYLCIVVLTMISYFVKCTYTSYKHRSSEPRPSLLNLN